MEIKKSDLLYLLISIALSGGSALVIGHPDAKVGLYSVGALLAVGLAISIYIKPSLGADVLIIAVFTNISRTFTDRGLPSVIQPLVGLVALAILVRYMYAASLPEGRVKTKRAESYLMFFFMVTAFSYLVADSKSNATAAIIELGKNIIIAYCILFTLRFPYTWKQSAWTIIVITTVMCLLGSYQVLSGNYTQEFFGLARVVDDVGTESTTHRIAGPIKEPNMWGQIVVAVVPLVIFRIIHERRFRVKLLSMGILGILLFEVLNTYSRGAYLGLAVILILMLLIERPNPLILFGVVAIAVFALPFLPSSYTARFETLSLLSPSSQNGIYKEGSFRGRSSQMLTGLNMFINNPLLGIGAGNYSNNYKEYTEDLGLEVSTGDRDAHSLYVQILAETGILGAIAFIGFSYYLITSLSRARRSIENLVAYKNWLPWINAIQLSIVGYLTTSIFLHGDYLRFFWIFVALALSAVQLTEELLIDPDRNQSLELPI